MRNISVQAKEKDIRRRQSAEKAALRERLRQDAVKQKASEQKHKEIGQRTKQWTEKVLPQWDNESSSVLKLKRELCYKGIPPSVRGYTLQIHFNYIIEII